MCIGGERFGAVCNGLAAAIQRQRKAGGDDLEEIAPIRALPELTS